MENPSLPDSLTVGRLLPGGGEVSIAPLHGDGSSRCYFRVTSGGRAFILQKGTNPKEDAAWLRINRHLRERGVRVPEVFGSDPGNGLILMEDLGQANLFRLAKAAKSEAELETLYLPVLSLLVRMQTKGADGFSARVGFNEPYGFDLMVNMEGGYFRREFAGNMLGLDAGEEVSGDIERLAREALKASGGYFLHRDFQSRNLHFVNGEWAVIDFQGARPGPLGYDVCALLLDPYVGLPKRVRENLFARYLYLLGEVEGVDVEAVRASLFPLGAFRLMQALGAFGKLGGREGKRGFLEYASPALRILDEELAGRALEFPALAAFVSEAERRWDARSA
jgi:aminoglycoside/choline kinase family phosphotransferase